MLFIDKAIDKGIERALKRARSDNAYKVKISKELTKPFKEFATYDIEHEVSINIHGIGKIDAATIVELQHKHNIPEGAALRMYNSGDGFGAGSSDWTVVFSWPDPNNITKEK